MRARGYFLFLLLAGSAFGGSSRAAPAPAPNEAPQSAPSRQKAVDDLLVRLRQAPNAEAAARLRAAIARLWGLSGSPTADLLMSRAESLLNSGQGAQAASLLERIVMLYPRWTLAWRRRAQLALMQGDSEGAILYLDHALIVEPRNFMAMTELANAWRKAGRNALALQLLRAALALDPRNDDLRRDEEKLEREVEGNRI